MKTDNELIAEFMGLMVFQTDDEMRQFPLEDLREWVRPDQCKYHQSWDWLMPVVEKIMFFAYVKIDNGQCMISVNGALVSGAVNGSNIENTYRAVVEFIKWHNTQNQTN